MTVKQQKILYRIITSVILLIASTVITHCFILSNWAKAVLFLIPYLIIGYDILIEAVKGIISKDIFNENFLMAVATIGALCLGDFLESVSVMLFFQIGELFQDVAVDKSRKNITALMDIRPDYANIEVDGRIQRIEPDKIEIGSEIIVNPGEKVPIDGVVISGETMLNTSALTGESKPVFAKQDDEIISGCVNMTGAIRIRTTKKFNESTVSKILELVENSSQKKSRSENFITKFAKYYTPIVCFSALALAILPPGIRLIAGYSGNWQDWIIRALTFLVISCPCALVISIPLSFFGGIGCASKNGVLVKGSNYLEALSKTKCIVFDKTGTLTKGFFEVTEIKPTESFTPDALIGCAAYAESSSSHPISMSIKKAYGQEIDISRVTDIEEIAGHGVKATFDGHTVLVGNKKLMNKFQVDFSPEENQCNVVYVSIDNKYAGYIVIADVIKPTAKKAVSQLKALGIKKSVMLTGDIKNVAKDVAKKIGIDQYKSELLPADKVTEIEKLLNEKDEGEKVAFVGDGINDAPVLSRADIGIAMGALGCDAAIEAADIVLMDDDPEKISLAIKISKKTLKIVKENISLAIAVKFICLLLGALGIANMWMAIFADVGIMVLSVINATRALKI